MDQKEKYATRARLALCILEALAANKRRKHGKKEDNFDVHKLNASLRKLASGADVEYSILQKITTGKKSPEFTTIAAIAAGLHLSPVQFAQAYSDVPLVDIAKFIKEKIIPYEEKQEEHRNKKKEEEKNRKRNNKDGSPRKDQKKRKGRKGDQADQ